jgi:hypothetical protein
MENTTSNKKIRHILDLLGVDPETVSGYNMIRLGDIIEGENVYMADKRHFWLFAKNHYAYESFEGAMQVLGRLCQNYTGNYSERDGLTLLIHLAQDFILEHPKRSHLLNEFISRLNPGSIIPYGDTYTERLFRAAMGTLAFVSVKDIHGDLGEADPDISPLSEATLKRLEEEEAKVA